MASGRRFVAFSVCPKVCDKGLFYGAREAEIRKGNYTGVGVSARGPVSGDRAAANPQKVPPPQTPPLQKIPTLRFGIDVL